MELRLQNIQFKNVVLKAKTDDKSVTKVVQTAMAFETIFSESKPRYFGIVFQIVLTSKKKDFKLTLDATAHFATSDDIDQSFRESDFHRVNGPAIAFPYVRSFISTLTLSAGYDTIILPSFNFQRLATEVGKHTIRLQK